MSIVDFIYTSAMDEMFVSLPPPPQISWNCNPQRDGIKRQGHWEVIRSGGCSLMNGGISTLIKWIPESLLVPSATWGYRENMATCEEGSKLLSDTESAIALILNFSASRIIINFCCLSATQSMVFCHGSSSRLRWQMIPFSWAQKLYKKGTCPLIWKQTTSSLCCIFKICPTQKSNIVIYLQSLKWGIICHQNWGIHFLIKRKKGNFETNLLCAWWTEPRPCSHSRQWLATSCEQGQPRPFGCC